MGKIFDFQAGATRPRLLVEAPQTTVWGSAPAMRLIPLAGVSLSWRDVPRQGTEISLAPCEGAGRPGEYLLAATGYGYAIPEGRQQAASSAACEAATVAVVRDGDLVVAASYKGRRGATEYIVTPEGLLQGPSQALAYAATTLAEIHAAGEATRAATRAHERKHALASVARAEQALAEAKASPSGEASVPDNYGSHTRQTVAGWQEILASARTALAKFM